MRLIARVGALTLATLLVTGLAAAQSNDGLSIHGFGGAAYAKTDNDNRWGNAATGEGEYGNYQFALNVAYQATDKVAVRSQVYWGQDLRGQDLSLDFAFAEWAHSPAFKVRLGKVLVPFGLYSEIYDVGTLRPFYFLPQFYQGSFGLIPKSYLGGGVTGVVPVSDEWDVNYDAYGGAIEFDPLETTTFEGFDPATGLPIVDTRLNSLVGRDMIGGRVGLSSPARGLDFGGGLFYTDDVKIRAEDGSLGSYSVTENATFYNLRLQWMRGSFGLRSEWFLVDTRDADLETFYVEASYRLTPHWQVAGQYEKMDLTLLPGDDSVFDPLGRSESIGAAVNYWITPTFVVKLNGYRVKGNLIAQSRQPIIDYILGTLDETTYVVVIGTQFSF